MSHRYGGRHKRLRQIWAAEVATGTVRCARCKELIEPGTHWDLGHDDDDPTRYNGPEHRKCNRSTASRDRRVVVVPRWALKEDDPARGVFWGPPSDVNGQQPRWSRPWTDWRGREANG